MNAPDLAHFSTKELGREQQYERLYQARQWFALHDAVKRHPGQSFYHGAIECIFNHAQQCPASLRTVLRSAPRSRDAYEARRLLSCMYLRRAQFRLALPHLQAMADYQETASLQAGRSLFTLLAGCPEQKVERFKPSKLHCIMLDGNMFLPTTINGTPVDCMIDSGAGLSFITRSEARRLGMEVQAAGARSLPMYAAIGDQTPYQIGCARTLKIGETCISNVIFLVLEDWQFEFPVQKQAALGLPVLLALRSLGWHADGTFFIGMTERSDHLAHADLCFDSGDLVVQASVYGQQMIFLLDTGCAATVLWPPFATRFKGLLRESTRVGSTRLSGVSGLADIGSATLSDIEFEIAGCTLALHKAPVLTEPTTPNSQWLFGQMGIDLLNQTKSVSLDFQTMAISLNCPLP
jgi:predicted aspartyl protease